MHKIIIDTDIGDDIDDALALSMAIHSPELELVGVTTVGSRSDSRAMIAKKLLETNRCGNIAVVAGASKPLKGAWDNEHVPFQYGPEMDSVKIDFGESAEEFLIRKVNENPGEVTVFAIGTLTNVARAIEKSESFKHNAKKIVLMGGAYTYHYREWNIVYDPEAAEIVFNSGIPIIAVGLEVSMKCSITVPEVLAVLEKNHNEPSEFLAGLVKRWDTVDVGRPIILFDLITLGALIDPTMIKMEDKLVRVETKGIYTRGMTYCFDSPFGEQPPEKPNAKVCMDIDVGTFLRLFKERSLLSRG